MDWIGEPNLTPAEKVERFESLGPTMSRGPYGGIDEPCDDGGVPYPPGRPGDGSRFAKDADLTVYWPYVRPCWEETPDDRRDP